MAVSDEGKAVIVEDIGDGLWLFSINRPRSLNALNSEIVQQLKEAFNAASKSVSARIILLIGKGKAFAAGADVSALVNFTPEEAMAFSRSGYELFSMMEGASQLIIAVLNGYAFGGGLELALSCDFRFAAENVQVALPEILLGIIPGFGGTQRLPSIVGNARAKDMILTGRKLDAAEALNWGLIHRIFPADRLLEESVSFAKDLATRANALACAKQVLNITGLTSSGRVGDRKQAFGRCLGTMTAVRACWLLEKRKPNFKNIKYGTAKTMVYKN